MTELDPVTDPATDDPVAALPAPGAPVVNPANALTLLRLLLVPVFAALLLVGDGHDTRWRLAATAVFVLASLTDRADGELARRKKLVTAVGQIADPIADKALMGAALIGLSVLGDVYWWVTVLVLAREVGVTMLRFWVIRHGVIPASRGGKAKTLLQSVAIGLYLLPLPTGADLPRAVVMGLAVAITAVTGLDYVARAFRLRASGRRR